MRRHHPRYRASRWTAELEISTRGALGDPSLVFVIHRDGHLVPIAIPPSGEPIDVAWEAGPARVLWSRGIAAGAACGLPLHLDGASATTPRFGGEAGPDERRASDWTTKHAG